MGGRIWAESEPGQGSTFHVSLPLREAPSATPEPATRPRHDEIRPLSILLAEDSQDNRALVRVYLRATAHTLHEVSDGLEAVERFRRERFDLVLMDMQMPVMDGYDATREIRRLEREGGLEKTPILALTAFALEGDRNKSLDAGCDGYLTKPFKKRQLLEAIAEFAGLEERGVPAN